MADRDDNDIVNTNLPSFEVHHAIAERELRDREDMLKVLKEFIRKQEGEQH